MKKLACLPLLVLMISACTDSNLKNKVDFEANIDKIDSNSYRTLTDYKTETMSAKIIPLEQNTNFEQYFSDLKKLDSLKKKNTYHAFLDALKPGEMADGGAYQVKTLHKSKTERYELWKLQYISLEASPYFFGSHLFLSYFRNDSLKSTFEIANNAKAGNSPDFVATKANARIKSDSVLVSMVKINKKLDRTDTIKVDKLIRIK
ncbi:MAG TPA: hypothetical protein VK175_03100 [Leadbetterella sp.]|nr:hypothetical protein [Leadbetterella sp.]